MKGKRYGTISKQLVQRNIKMHPKIPNNIDIQLNFLPNPHKHPEDVDGVNTWNVEKSSHPNASVCPWKYHVILSPRKLELL